MGIIAIRDDAHWHELRRGCVGGSEIAALFDLSPYLSYWQLWQQKAGNLPAADLSDNNAVKAGTFFEEGIAKWAAEKWGWDIQKVREYRTCEKAPGLGATLDYEIIKTLHPVEIKWSVRGHGWDYEGEEIVKAPEGYLLQVQAQIGATESCYDHEIDGGWLVAFLGGEPRRMWVPRKPTIIDAIREEVTAFWQSIAEKKEPAPDFECDGAGILALIEETPRTDLVIADTDEEYERIAQLFDWRKAADELEKAAKAGKEAFDAELLDIVRRRAAKANTSQEKVSLKCGDLHRLTISTVAENPGTLVTEAMVGTRINTRKGHSRKTFA